MNGGLESKDVVTYIQNYKGMKNVKEAEIFDELKNGCKQYG